MKKSTTSGSIFLKVAVLLQIYVGSAFAEFTAFSRAGAESKDAVKDSIGAYLWVTALVPFIVAAAMAFKKHSDIQDKDEQQGQSTPKMSRNLQIIFAGVLGIFIMYLLYGIFFMAFADSAFNDTWKKLVMDVIKDLFGF